MATDIVQSLFGVTPELYQQQQAALADKRALELATLTPMQRAEFNIGRGAYGLAGALGGADPVLQLISFRQSIAQQIDPTNAESVQAGIQALQQRDPQGAMMLAQEYRRLQESGALVAQREAAAKASIAAANRERAQAVPADILKAREIAALQERRDLLATTGGEAQQIALLDRQIAALEGEKPVAVSPGTVLLNPRTREVIYSGEPKLPSVGEAREAVAQAAPYGKPYAQLTPTEKAEVNRIVEAAATARARAGAISVTQVAEKAEAGARGKMLVDEYKAISDQARVGARALPALEANLTTLDNGFKTGFGTEAKAVGARILASLGVKDAERYATDAQTFLANASDAVLQRQLEQKGPQTEADAQRITQTGAQLGSTIEANRFLLSVAKAQIKRGQAQRDFYDAWFRKNKTYDGAENAWYQSEGGQSLFERPELKAYAARGTAAAQIPTAATTAAAATPPGMPAGFRVIRNPNP